MTTCAFLQRPALSLTQTLLDITGKILYPTYTLPHIANCILTTVGWVVPHWTKIPLSYIKMSGLIFLYEVCGGMQVLSFISVCGALKFCRNPASFIHTLARWSITWGGNPSVLHLRHHLKAVYPMACRGQSLVLDSHRWFALWTQILKVSVSRTRETSTVETLDWKMNVYWFWCPIWIWKQINDWFWSVYHWWSVP